MPYNQVIYPHFEKKIFFNEYFNNTLKISAHNIEKVFKCFWNFFYLFIQNFNAEMAPEHQLQENVLL